jgi:hypothetical protein
MPAASSRRPPRRFDSPQQECYLNLWRTYDRLRMVEDELFLGHDLTAQQYNALRLLRAEHPAALPTLVLAGKLVSHAPDITRLVHQKQLGHLTNPQLQSLIDLLRTARQPHELEESPWR